MAKKKKKATDKNASFEDSIIELRGIVDQLEQGELGLEQSLEQFETGMQLLRTCYAILENAEQKIEVLTRLSNDGVVKTQPFDATATLESQMSEAAEENANEDDADDGALF